MALVEKYGPSLLRVARMYVPTQSAAEEVVAGHVARASSPASSASRAARR